MAHLPTSWLRGVCLALILVGVVLSCWFVKRAADDIQDAAARMVTKTEELKATAEKMLTSSWVDAEGITRTVPTPRDPGEDFGDYLSRHDAEVAEALVKWP